MDEDGFDFEGEWYVVHQTPKAILVARKGGDEQATKMWVPQWAVHEDSEVFEEGTEGKLIVKVKFAEDEGHL